MPADVLSIDALCPQTQWIPVSERPRCVGCNTSFAFFRKPHHCRLCGEVVCRACTEKRPVRHRTLNKVSDVLICTGCLTSPRTARTKADIGLRAQMSPMPMTDARPSPPSSSQCHVCACTFTFARWKHKCRWCQHDVCGHCRPSAPNKRLGVDGKVCLQCLLERTHQTMAARQPPATNSKRSSDSASSPRTDTASSFGSVTSLPYPLDYSWSHPWPKPPLIAHEARRLETLRCADILDTPADDVFELLCDLAIKATGCSMAAVAFVDADRVWFKARMGLAQSSLPRDVAFCAHTIRSTDPLVVVDAALDPRFEKNPLVTGRARIRFYAGAPIVAPTGLVLGTVFVLDSKPRETFDPRSLQKLANIAMAHIKLNKKGYLLS
ncbi:hypothetical protein SDRG_08012, partial [Saprolegnia diclina VS20]